MLSYHEYLFVFEVFASEGDVELSLDLVLSVDTGFSFVVLVFPVHRRRSIIRDDEVKAEVVVSISQEAAFPVSNCLLGTDEGMLLLLLFRYSLLVFTFAFVAEGVELDLLLAFERHVKSFYLYTAHAGLVADTDVHFSVDLLSRAVVGLFSLDDHISTIELRAVA